MIIIENSWLSCACHYIYMSSWALYQLQYSNVNLHCMSRYLFGFKYDQGQKCYAPRFDPTRVQTHDLQIMTVRFMSLRHLLQPLCQIYARYMPIALTKALSCYRYIVTSVSGWRVCQAPSSLCTSCRTAPRWQWSHPEVSKPISSSHTRDSVTTS